MSDTDPTEFDERLIYKNFSLNNNELWTLLIIFQTPVHILLKVEIIDVVMPNCLIVTNYPYLKWQKDLFSDYSFLYHRQDFHLTLIWVTRWGLIRDRNCLQLSSHSFYLLCFRLGPCTCCASFLVFCVVLCFYLFWSFFCVLCPHATITTLYVFVIYMIFTSLLVIVT